MKLKHNFRAESRDLSMELDTKHEIRQQMLSFFCNHFVSLVGSYTAIEDGNRETGEEQFFAFSGFILSVRGV